MKFSISEFFGYENFGKYFFGYSKLMFLFFVLYYLMLSGTSYGWKFGMEFCGG